MALIQLNKTMVVSWKGGQETYNLIANTLTDVPEDVGNYIKNSPFYADMLVFYESFAQEKKKKEETSSDQKISSKSLNANKIEELTSLIRASGYPIYNILRQIHEAVINNKKLTDRMKSIISLHFAKTEKRLIDGADEYLQLLSALMCIRSVTLKIDSIHSVF